MLSRLLFGSGKEDDDGKGGRPLTTAPESSASAISLKGACLLAIGGGCHQRIIGKKGVGGQTC